MVSIGPHLWTASKDNRIRVWNTEAKTCIKILDNVGGSQVTALIHTKDDQVLSGGGDGSIKSFSAGSLEWKRTFPLKHDREVTGLYWDETNNLLWAGSLDKRVTIWK
jgi:WD40 repeat protein